MSSEFVYLDYAASAPVRKQAYQAQEAYRKLACAGANPNSLHSMGRMAHQVLEDARRDLVQALGGGFRPPELLFTSGGTESNNLAIYGIAEGVRRQDPSRTTVIISAIEHDSILDLVSELHERGFSVVLLPPRCDGKIYADDLAQRIDEHCALVSVMHANNETGIVMDTISLARVAHSAGAHFHTDAIQAFGRIPLCIDEVDVVSIAAHKIGAPIGIGAVAIRKTCPFKAQNFGGGQEFGRRPGTQDVQSAYVFATIAKLVMQDLPSVRAQVAAKAQAVYDRLCQKDTHIVPTTTALIDENRLPGLVSIMVDGLDSETLVLQLDARGYEASAGSACSSASLEPSHVLKAMGIPRDLAFGALRISFDERVSSDVLDGFCDTLLDIVARYR